MFNTNTSFVVLSVGIVSPVTKIEPLTFKEPVISCLSTTLSPNLFEPEENITDDEINVVCNSVDVIRPPTFRFCVITTEPVIFELPFTAKPPPILPEPVTTNSPRIDCEPVT